MPLATFENPPLNEVSFGVHFSPISGFKTAHYGALWSRLGPAFDQTEDKPVVAGITLPPTAEWFPLPRVWFVERGKAVLLQIQPNRFYFNWRKGGPGTPYPRFDSLEPLFEKYFSLFLSFMKEMDLGVPEITGAELAYVNHLPQGQGWTSLQEVQEVFPSISLPSAPSLGLVDGLLWHVVFDTEAGRFDADVKSGKQKAEPHEGVLLFEMKVTQEARLGSMENLREWLSNANNSIVAGFLELTSEKMQNEVWRRVRS